jgi:hypothetical protein
MRGSHRSSEDSGLQAPGFGLACSPKPVARSPFYTAAVSMSEDSTRNWTRTYVSVIIIEVLALMGLWWLQSHYGT